MDISKIAAAERLLNEVEQALSWAAQHLDEASDHTAETLETLRRGADRVRRDLEAANDAATNKLTETRARR